MSYMRSSYKASSSSSSYRYSSGNDGLGTGSSTSASRFRTSFTSGDDDIGGGGSSSFGTYSTRRTSNYEPTSLRNIDDDLGTSSIGRRSYQSSRFTTASHLDSDYDMTGDSSTSRYSSSKYKITSIDDDDDDLGSSRITSRKYSRYSSRDDNEGGITGTTTTSRISRYSSLESPGDDDYGLSSMTSSSTRRRTKLSYLNEDDDVDNDDDGRFTSSRKSFRPSLSYDVKSPSIIDDNDNRFSSYSDRRRSTGVTSTMNRSLSRMDSKEVSSLRYIFFLSFCFLSLFLTINFFPTRVIIHHHQLLFLIDAYCFCVNISVFLMCV